MAFNGRALTKRLRRSIGFVLQDDLLYENLTVYETLYYAAMLRLPRELPEADKVARVNAVIAALGIESCRNTIIGARRRCMPVHQVALLVSGLGHNLSHTAPLYPKSIKFQIPIRRRAQAQGRVGRRAQAR